MSTIKVNRILTSSGGEGVDADIIGNVTGNVSAPDSITVGTAVTISAGVVTATSFSGSFSGDGSNLTGIDSTKIETGNTKVETVDTGSNGHVKITTEGSEKFRVTSGGNVGIGTDNPDALLDVQGILEIGNLTDISPDASGSGQLRIDANGYNPYIAADATAMHIGHNSSARDLRLQTNETDRLTIDGSTGNVGIGETSPTAILHIAGGTARPALFMYGSNKDIGYNSILQFGEWDGTTYTERMRIDSSGRLLVGTPSTRTVNFWDTPQVQIEGTNYQESSLSIYNNQNFTYGAVLALGKSRGTSIGSNTVVQDDDYLGTIAFYGSDGSDERRGAEICAFSDGTPGSGDMPGRLVFSTTADGSSNPTERMRIHSDGVIGMAMGNFDDKSVDTNSSNGGFVVLANGGFECAVNGETCSRINRMGADGTLIAFLQAGSLEGYIAVSGSTVSYNGGHLARMSQTVETADPAVLLKGTVMTNLNEMCEWRNEDGSLEDNEQLNKMAVSSVEGDPNVAGVMVNIDEDGDLNVAMTGDMIIRIAQGTTVARGDLLMSAGDGTAKPQDDDIVRSKTIAKVTSTTVSETYSDGSYCVPCVLMAC